MPAGRLTMDRRDPVRWYPERALVALSPDSESSRTLIVDYATGKVAQCSPVYNQSESDNLFGFPVLRRRACDLRLEHLRHPKGAFRGEQSDFMRSGGSWRIRKLSGNSESLHSAVSATWPLTHRFQDATFETIVAPVPGSGIRIHIAVSRLRCAGRQSRATPAHGFVVDVLPVVWKPE